MTWFILGVAGYLGLAGVLATKLKFPGDRLGLRFARAKAASDARGGR